MGAYGLSGTELGTYSRAADLCPLVLLMHWADMAESHLKPAVAKARERRAAAE